MNKIVVLASGSARGVNNNNRALKLFIAFSASWCDGRKF